ncbi:MAG: enoyl-CoA hydratase-related protein [Myxococcales bacterium]|nr:enoyl-CoA hydratase-related protein [Myxococcota bacterium]MDW8280328.1 enoyl-CoA hydratase-related protein [Myxococcales bacterium]
MDTTPTLPSPSVHYERIGDRGIALLTLDRQQTRNALGPAEWHALGRHISFIAADQTVRVVIITGAGGAFSSGGDLRTMPARLELPPAERHNRLLSDASVIRAIYELGQPVIAAIPGACVGAGLALALACDLRLCSSTARLGAPFHRVGLTGDFGLLWLLPRVVGPARAAELLYTAALIDAQRAEAMGLVHRVVAPEQLMPAAIELAEQMAQGPPLAQAMTKRGLRRALECDLAAMLEWEAQAQAILSRTDDAREGVTAFLEHRPPQFQGR